MNRGSELTEENLFDSNSHAAGRSPHEPTEVKAPRDPIYPLLFPEAGTASTKETREDIPDRPSSTDLSSLYAFAFKEPSEINSNAGETEETVPKIERVTSTTPSQPVDELKEPEDGDYLRGRFYPCAKPRTSSAGGDIQHRGGNGMQGGRRESGAGLMKDGQGQRFGENQTAKNGDESRGTLYDKFSSAIKAPNRMYDAFKIYLRLEESSRLDKLTRSQWNLLLNAIRRDKFISINDDDLTSKADKVWAHMRTYLDSKPDEDTYAALLDLYASIGNIWRVRKVLGEMEIDGISYDTPRMLRFVMYAYARAGDVQEATKLYNRSMAMAPKLGLSTTNMLMRAYNQVGNTDALMEVFNNMKENGITPDATSYHTVMIHFVDKNPAKSMEVFNAWLATGAAPTQHMYNTVIYVCIQNKDLVRARQFIREARKLGPSVSLDVNAMHLETAAGNAVATWAAFWKIFRSAHKVANAQRVQLAKVMGPLEPGLVRLKKVMKAAGVPFTDDALKGMVRGYRMLGDVKSVEALHAEYEKKRWPMQTIDVHLLATYYNAGDPASAEGFVERLLQSGRKIDVHMYRLILWHNLEQGDEEKVVETLQGMREGKVELARDLLERIALGGASKGASKGASEGAGGGGATAFDGPPAEDEDPES
ncbi:hypothetical protein HK104_005298 [Borealophlyctis nickersoniae]|nr:hypothetical protein HK104_005298 [Borealophlyctis nickersoniae]